MRRYAAVVAVLMTPCLMLGSPIPAAQADSGPVVRFDYTMPDNIGTLLGQLPANGAVRAYDFSGRFVPQNPMQVVDADLGATNYGKVPADGRYEVNLSACASTVAANPIFEWVIDGQRYVREECGLALRLPEGQVPYQLRVLDDSGASAITGTFTVKDTLIAIMGDGYASGEGWPPFRQAGGDTEIAWDAADCHRSRWSGFVRAAAQAEAADPRSSVTVLNVACTGATIDAGMLGPLTKGRGAARKTIPAQFAQLNTLRKDQAIDQVLLSIGAADIGLTDIIGPCANRLSGRCFEEMMQPTDRALDGLSSGFTRLAACLGAGDCEIRTPGSTTSSLPGLRIQPSAVVHVAYPNLFVGPPNPVGYPPDTNRGGLCNVATDEAPLLYGDSWWASNIAMNGTAGTRYLIPKWRSGAAGTGNPATETLVPFTATADGLAQQTASHATRFGWHVAQQPYTATTEQLGGICAYPTYNGVDGDLSLPPGVVASRAVYTAMNGATDTFEGALNFFGQLHPNELGQELYRASLAPEVRRATGEAVGPPAVSVVPGPAALSAPSGLTLKNLRKHTATYRHLSISFRAPATGPKPTAYMVRVKVAGASARTIRDRLKEPHTVWRTAPKGKRVKVRVGSLLKRPLQISWGGWRSIRIRS